MKYNEEIITALEAIRNSKKILRNYKIIQHEKTIHCELAEWIVAEYLGGTRAISGNQKGWDIELRDGQKIQVKSHAKSRTNISDWTTLSPYSEEVALIYIIVFTPDYFIKEVFCIDSDTAYSICNKKREITWPKLRNENKHIDLLKLKKLFPFFFK
jgi:hypothetical protein